jgi:hypothetical protein
MEAPAYGERRRHLPLTWLGVLAVGWVLYELTARPQVAVVAVCVKFGWEDFRTALWLRRRDPWPYRGRACFWLYLSSGLCRITLTALMMSVGFILVQAHLAAGGRGVNAVLSALRLTGIGGLVSLICVVLTLVGAIRLARRGRIRLWLGSIAHRARRSGSWPPGDAEEAGRNLLGEDFLLVGLGLSVLLAVTVTVLMAGNAAGVQWLAPPLSLVWFTAPALVIAWWTNTVQSHVTANHPLECWGAPGPDEDAADKDRMAANRSHEVH